MASLALVVLDSVRRDRFERYFEWLPGRRFEAAYSTANWTAPAHASLLAGRYGSEVGVAAGSPALGSEVPYLPEQLRVAGYRTRGLSANVFFSGRFGWDRGFDEFVGPAEVRTGVDAFDWSPYTAREGDTSAERAVRYARGLLACARSDHDTVRSVRAAYRLLAGADLGAGQALSSFVREHDPADREFLVANLMEAHTPYAPPSPDAATERPVSVTAHHALTDADPPDETPQAYDEAVRYLSDVYRDVFAGLASTYDYVVTCADHGELLGEHGGRWNHTYGLYPELARVPLVVSGGGLDGTDSRPSSLLDVHATLLDLADVDATSRGDSLVGDPDERDYLVEYRGLIDLARQRLLARGLADEDVDRYDRPLDALVGREGYYGYETLDGWREVGTATEGPPGDRLQRLKADLATPDRADSHRYDEETIQRLDDLGYL